MMQLKLTYFILLLSISLNFYAQNYVQSNFKFDTTKISVNFDENYSAAERNKFVSDDRIIPLDENKRCYNTPSIFTLKPGLTQIDVEQLLVKLNSIFQIVYAAPVLYYPNGSIVQITNKMHVKLKPGVSINLLEGKAQEQDLILKKVTNETGEDPTHHLNDYYTLEIPKNNMYKSFEIVKDMCSVSFFEVATIGGLQYVIPLPERLD